MHDNMYSTHSKEPNPHGTLQNLMPDRKKSTALPHWEHSRAYLTCVSWIVGDEAGSRRLLQFSFLALHLILLQTARRYLQRCSRAGAPSGGGLNMRFISGAPTNSRSPWSYPENSAAFVSRPELPVMAS